MEMPGIEPGAFHMQSERSTTELHPHLANVVTNNCQIHKKRAAVLQILLKIFCLSFIIFTLLKQHGDVRQ